MPNRLSKETSPYLLQHAHNPVDWYPWGDEALERAIKEDKPILVSIGYSACHWCHVMERESFEDNDTAALMNKLFINIKVDREERPDLDHIYMEAVQAIAGNGGWPLNVFLTPDKKPFYGGTYFPPVPAFNRSSWKQVLEGVSQLYKEKRAETIAQAEELTNHIGNNSIVSTLFTNDNDEGISLKDAEDMFQQVMKSADKKWGGFGRAPKFPQTFTINFLLRYYYYSGSKEALDHAILSLDKMIQGGIYDQAGGGFSRYSTDAEWLAPHFEKMLYDNALLIGSVSNAYSITRNENYRSVIEETIRFIEREMSAPEGGFYSALDADSEGEEGKFYVWSYDEVTDLLGDDAVLFCKYYDITPSGNWEGKNILRVLVPVNEFASDNNIDQNELTVLLKRGREKLLSARNKRIRPHTDDKIILGWNAMMISALCKASSAFNNDDYRALAEKQFEFIWNTFRKEGKFYHTYKDGIVRHPAFLDDLATLIDACLQLQEVTSDPKYISKASEVLEIVLKDFKEEDRGLFYYTPSFQHDVIVRKTEIYDSAVASGNSMMASNLLYLGILTGNNDWKEHGLNLITKMRSLVIKYPTSFGNWASLLLDNKAGLIEIAITGEGFESLRSAVLAVFIPNKIFQSAKVGDEKFPLLAGKKPEKEPLIYVCFDYSCRAPVKDIDAMMTEIKRYISFH